MGPFMGVKSQGASHAEGSHSSGSRWISFLEFRLGSVHEVREVVSQSHER